MIDFHFFGRECAIDKDLKDRSNLTENLLSLNFKFSHILLLNQIHSNQVAVIDDVSKIYGIENLPKADAIVTNLKNIALGVVTADCAPIIFYDDDAKIIGACHAGWRGAKSGIISATISNMEKLGAKNIKAVIGPTIQQYSYQVSQEFYDDFLLENINSQQFFKKDKEEGKWQFNLPLYVDNKISKSGVCDIDNVEIDTYTNIKNYFSYRRSSHLKESLDGRNIAIICINE